MHGIVCNCAVLNVIALYCMVPSCIDTVIVILSDLCGIGVVRSENLKKLPALPAGSILAQRKEGRRVMLGLCATVLAPSSIADWMKLSGEAGMEPFAHQSMLLASNTSSLFHRLFNFRG